MDGTPLAQVLEQLSCQFSSQDLLQLSQMIQARAASGRQKQHPLLAFPQIISPPLPSSTVVHPSKCCACPLLCSQTNPADKPPQHNPECSSLPNTRPPANMAGKSSNAGSPMRSRSEISQTAAPISIGGTSPIPDKSAKDSHYTPPPLGVLSFDRYGNQNLGLLDPPNLN
eukprot:TRINITY_DN59134_c0_g1_i1.p1 TRINITY_DN59134_c0_g1~~TRINITY_DN59134_c0_g1_i1.p1  ORF type:complete len:170 (-),score=11.82 TRINITY_DN59134_c0_g1_i1:30-539(-)